MIILKAKIHRAEEKKCEEVGINFSLFCFSKDVTEEIIIKNLED